MQYNYKVIITKVSINAVDSQNIVHNLCSIKSNLIQVKVNNVSSSNVDLNCSKAKPFMAHD